MKFTIEIQQNLGQILFKWCNINALRSIGDPAAKPVAEKRTPFLLMLFAALLTMDPVTWAARPKLPDGPSDPIFELQDEDRPPNPPGNIRVVERNATSIELSWPDSSRYEEGYQLQRRVPSTSSQWQTVNSWGPQSEWLSYTDNDVQPDMKYCYRVRIYNFIGDKLSPLKCVYSRDGNDYTVWRAQITFHTADISDADTDDSVYVGLNAVSRNFIPSGNRTFLDYGRDDFERDDLFTYDLNLKNLSEISDITRISISKSGNNGWCLADFVLTINGLDMYSEDFSGLADGCLWLDNDNGNSRTHVVTHEMLRAHPDWQNYNHTTALFLLALNGIPNEEMVSRLEGMTGDFIQNNKLYWGHLHGPAVEVTRGCPANVESCQTIHVDFDLAASVTGPNPGVDVDFDLNFECSDGDLTIKSSNVVVDVDSRWYWEVLSLGLINFLDGEVEDRVEDGWNAIEETLEVGADCQISVNEYGDITIEAGEPEQPAIVIPRPAVFHTLPASKMRLFTLP